MSGASEAAGDHDDAGAFQLVVVTGRSGAGRTTAINALEDLGFETIDTPPLDFVPAMAAKLSDDAGDEPRRLAIGVDARTAGCSPSEVETMLAALRGIRGARISMLFLDGSDDALRKRYKATRRRHPLAPTEGVDVGLERDRERMLPLRAFADLVIDTSQLTPHELRRVVQRRFSEMDGPDLTIAVASFSYRNGLPPDADMVFDCRFLRNPFYVEALRPLDGRDPAVAGHVAGDANFAAYLSKVTDLAAFLLPSFAAEGKSYLTLAFGCTGGRHRSVAMAEAVAGRLRSLGWRLSVQHRELVDSASGDEGAPADENGARTGEEAASGAAMPTGAA